MPSRVSWFTPFNGNLPHREHRSRKGRQKNRKESTVIKKHLENRRLRRELKKQIFLKKYVAKIE